MKRAEFDAWMRAETDAVETALQTWVPADAPARLGQTMRYGVLDGGKRVRPLLVLAAAQAVHGHADAAIVIAAGSDNGVQLNDAVVTADGLVGVVTNVTPGTARAASSPLTPLNSPRAGIGIIMTAAASSSRV